MDDLCFCTFENIVNCLVEKTKISLPVLITACALGYIWTARKQIKDKTKQCVVLEDDMKHIKRENYQLGEEIRRLKCAVSDSELLTTAFNKSYLDRSRPKTKQCSFTDKAFDNECNDQYRCISRKMKKRKSRKASPQCEANCMQLMSFSTPEVYVDSTIKTSPKCKNYTEISRLEWCPRGESTKIFKENKLDCNECDFQTFNKPEKVSFCETARCEPKTKNCDFGNCDVKRSFKCRRSQSKSPEPIIQSFDCYRYVHRTKPKSPKNNLPMWKSDLISSSCKNFTNDYKCKSPQSRRNPYQTLNDKLFSSCENRCKSPKRNNVHKECCPENMSTSLKLKEKIQKYRNEITNDLNSLEIISDCNLFTKDKLTENKCYDLTKTDNNCNACELKQYSFKKWEKSRCR